MSDKSEGMSPYFWAGMAAPAVIAAWIVPAVMVRAWALTILWGWYVAPTFGLAPLHVAAAFGLSIIVNMLRGGVPQKDERSTPHKLAGPFIGPMAALGAGWVGSFFL